MIINSGNIIGKTVNLRTAEPKDAEYTLSIRMSGHKTQYLNSFTGSLESQKRWIQEKIDSEDACFCIAELKDGTPIGTYGFEELNQTTRSADTGHALLLGNMIQNSEAVFLLYQYMFNVLNLKVVTTDILEQNNASIGITKRFGGIKTSECYSDLHKMKLLHFEITSEAFAEKEKVFNELLERFGDRIS